MFTITPKNNSDYIISTNISTLISIEEQHKLISHNADGERMETLVYLPISDEKITSVSDCKMKVILAKDKTYRITVENDNSNKYTVMIQQDNWVIAPKGGVIYYDDNHLKIFFTKEMVQKIVTYTTPHFTWDESSKNFRASLVSPISLAFFQQVNCMD